MDDIRQTTINLKENTLKNEYFFMVFMASGLLFSNYVNSATPTKKEVTSQSAQLTKSTSTIWSQEPSSFLGIELNQPISKSVPNKCSLDQTNTSVCAMPVRVDKHRSGVGDGYDLFTQFAVPNIHVPFAKPFSHTGGIVWVHTLENTLDGTVAVVTVEFDSEDFSQILPMFVVKYGEPHKKEFEKLKTKGGAEFENIKLSWTGEKVSIFIESLAQRRYHYGDKQNYDYGSIQVLSTEYLTKQSQENHEAAKKGAAGL